jgi:chloride channel protein, CIC family
VSQKSWKHSHTSAVLSDLLLLRSKSLPLPLPLAPEDQLAEKGLLFKLVRLSVPLSLSSSSKQRLSEAFVEILRNRPGVFRALVLALSAFTGAIGAKLITGHTGLRFLSENNFDISIITIGSILLLSIIAAFVALSFGVILNIGRVLFKRITFPHILKPALGGFMIGLVGLLLPYIHEPAAYPLMIDMISLTSLPLTLLAIILIIKMCATSITLGSGGSGGIFAPLLLMGAVTGSILGSVLILSSLGTADIVPTLVFIGMATVFAAAAHAPLTAAFITYEMTENISLLIPLIIACFIATTLAKKIHPRSVYHHEV